MQSKLIIVEGIPGSGKSTTAKLIQEILSEMQVENELIIEGDLDHPADYDGEAFFTHEEYEELLANYEHYSDLFENHIVKKDNGYFIPYYKLKLKHESNFPNELFQALAKKDIYELPLEKNRELITRKWEEFARSTLDKDKVYIFECCFMQNPLTISMIKYNAANEATKDYVSGLASTVEKLQPILIYVDQDNIEKSFRKVTEERSSAWYEGFVEYYTNQGYGKYKGYKGLEGTIEVLKAREELERVIFEQLNLKKHKVNNSKFDLDTHKANLAKILSN